jgi:hypothetical protein
MVDKNPSGTPLAEAKIDDSTHAAIGRLLRAMAEIENLVDAYLCRLAHISDGQALILLGKSNQRTKLEMARYCATLAGPEHIALHKELFGAEAFDALVTCRNDLAHGALLGVNPDGYLMFMTSTRKNPQDGFPSRLVAGHQGHCASGFCCRERHRDNSEAPWAKAIARNISAHSSRGLSE